MRTCSWFNRWESPGKRGQLAVIGGSLRENLTDRLTLLLVPVACDVMYRFSNCQRPPINDFPSSPPVFLIFFWNHSFGGHGL
jgi:hypothetical protein